MASNIWLISEGTNYYLSGGGASQTTYAGSGTPWTSQSTTPYELSLNDETGNIWTPQAAPAQVVYGGGPPFHIGQSLIYNSYGNVVETVGVQLRATTHDHAVTLLRLLRQALSTALYSVPCVLAVQMDGASSAAYFEIYHADIQELPNYIVETRTGDALFRVAITWTRSPLGSTLSSGETVISSVSINNNFSGSPDNVIAYSAGSGDLIHEGQPLNMTLTNATGSTLTDLDFYLGSIDSIISDSTTQTVTTSSTTGASPGSGDTITVGTTLDPQQALKMRLIAQTSSVSANSEMRLKVYFSSSAAAPFYVGPWRAPQSSASLYDAGTIPSSLFKDTGITTLLVLLEVRSPLGGSITITLGNFYIVCYYTLCKISGLNSISNSTGVIHLRSFVVTSNRPCLPMKRSEVYVLNSGSQTYYGRVAGMPPVYVSGASLWHMAVHKTNLTHASAAHTVTATHAPLWKTLRGND